MSQTFSPPAADGGDRAVRCTLAVIGWFAVRRSRLQWWEQLVALLILVALGLGVISLQTLAHSIAAH